MKPIVFILLALLVVPTLAHAYILGANSSFILTTTNGTYPQNMTWVNVSYYYDNISNLWRASKSMTTEGTGTYIDYVIFNQTGEYIGIALINDSGLVYERYVYFTVEEDTDMILAITLTLMFTTIIGLFLAKEALSKPNTNTGRTDPNKLSWGFKEWGVLYMAISALSVIILLAVIGISTNNTPYDGLMDSVTIVSIILFGLFAILYLYFFFQGRFISSIESFRK